MTILVGTSGFSYDDWKGPFYSASLPKNQFLSFYSGSFSALEVNYTYYRMPSAKTVESMVKNSGGKVEMVFKLHQSMTHEKAASEKEAKAFLQAIGPAVDAGVTDTLLAQFPFSFLPGDDNRSVVEEMARWFGSMQIVVEFRNDKWINQETFQWMQEKGISFCCVDEPMLKGLIPPHAVVTGPVGYVRFHGRNKAKWWKHDKPEERYDYLYTADELKQWTPKIKRIDGAAKKTFIFMNNHFQAKAVQNARMLLDLLK